MKDIQIFEHKPRYTLKHINQIERSPVISIAPLDLSVHYVIPKFFQTTVQDDNYYYQHIFIEKTLLDSLNLSADISVNKNYTYNTPEAHTFNETEFNSALSSFKSFVGAYKESGVFTSNTYRSVVTVTAGVLSLSFSDVFINSVSTENLSYIEIDRGGSTWHFCYLVINIRKVDFGSNFYFQMTKPFIPLSLYDQSMFETDTDNMSKKESFSFNIIANNLSFIQTFNVDLDFYIESPGEYYNSDTQQTLVYLEPNN